MKEYVLRYFSWLASHRFRLAMLLGLTLPTILLADSLTSASACSMACRSYEVEAAASDLVFLGQVEDVRVENGSSVASVRPLRWIKGSTQLPIVATAPLRRTRMEREFGCPGPIRVTRGTVRVFGAMRSPDGASFSVRTDYCANAALNSPGNPAMADFGPRPTPPSPPQVSQWMPRGIPDNRDRPAVAEPPNETVRRPQTGLSDMTFSSASCIKQGEVGSASCAAICPAGQLVLHCSHSAGNLSSGDTCTSLGRISSIAAVASGQPQPQPHDRCVISASCSDRRSTLSVQGWATCYQSNQAIRSASCETISEARSPKNFLGLNIAMRNMSRRPRALNWINFEGKAVLVKMLAPSEEYLVRTAPGHVWAFLNRRGDCMDVYVAGVGEDRFDLEK